MVNDNTRILIMGVGGLGGVFSAGQIAAGRTPTLVTHNPAITAAIHADGLRLTTPDGKTSTYPATAYTTVADLSDSARFDAVWLLMKANGVREAARAARPLLSDDGYMVSFQNGMVEEIIIEELGDATRLMTSIVAFGGTMTAPGVYRRTTDGSIYIGELDGTVTPRLETLRNQLSAIIHTEISTNIHGLLWGKLTWNATVNGLGAVAGHTFGELVSTDLGRDLTLRGYTEVIDVARALGVEVVPEVVGPTTALHLPSGADAGARRQRYDVLHAMTETFAAVYPSSLQSLERGRPTETAFLNGHVVAKAQIVGVEVPLNTALIDMIAEIERGEREITPANLHDLAAYR